MEDRYLPCDSFSNWNQTLKELIQRNVQIYKKQRPLDPNHVTSIKKFILDDYQKYGQLFFYQPIYICSRDGQDYIVDGQHRYQALVELIIVEKGLPFEDVELQVKRKHVISEEQMSHIFNILNFTKPMNTFYTSQDTIKTIIDNVLNTLNHRYDNFSENDHAKRPNIRLSVLRENLSNIINENTKSDILLQAFEKVNLFYKRQSVLYFKKLLGGTAKDHKTLETIHKKISKNDHYLGLFLPKHASYWTDTLLQFL